MKVVGNNLEELYKVMYQIRYAEELIVQFYSNDEMKTPMHMSMGSEAIAAGVCSCLKDEDKVLGTYRTHALYIAKTKETYKFFAELHGRADGVSAGRGGSMHMHSLSYGYLVSSGIVGGTLSVGVGAGLASKMRKNGQVVAIFFGDGAADTGTFWESVNFACLMRLPVFFVLENNGLAVNSPRARRYGHKGIFEVLENYDLLTERNGTNDVESIQDSSRKCVEAIRSGQGPAFLEVDYSRILDHIGIQPCMLRDEQTVLLHDPVKISRKKLVYISGDAHVLDIENEIRINVKEGFDNARLSPFARPEQCMEKIW